MSRLHLVAIATEIPDDAAWDAVKLDEGLYLIRGALTRSQLYHALKRRLDPQRLLVAPLAEGPKFKGLKPGALKAARALEDRGGRGRRS